MKTINPEKPYWCIPRSHEAVSAIWFAIVYYEFCTNQVNNSQFEYLDLSAATQGTRNQTPNTIYSPPACSHQDRNTPMSIGTKSYRTLFSTLNKLKHLACFTTWSQTTQILIDLNHPPCQKWHMFHILWPPRARELDSWSVSISQNISRMSDINCSYSRTKINVRLSMCSQSFCIDFMIRWDYIYISPTPLHKTRNTDISLNQCEISDQIHIKLLINKKQTR